MNLEATDILGIKSYTTVTDLPQAADMAVIMTPRQPTPSIVKECTDKDITSIVVMAQGFADAFPDKPVISHLYGHHVAEAESILHGSGKTVVFPSIESAVRTLSHLVSYYRRRFEAELSHP